MIPAHVDQVFYILAPAVGVATALIAFAVVPFGPTAPPPDPVAVTADRPLSRRRAVRAAAGRVPQRTSTSCIAPGVDIGILYVFAIGSLAVYGVILAGWASNNKYSLLGVAARSAPSSSATRSRWACRSWAWSCSPARSTSNTIVNWQDAPRLGHLRPAARRSCCS